MGNYSLSNRGYLLIFALLNADAAIFDNPYLIRYDCFLHSVSYVTGLIKRNKPVLLK